MFPGALFLKFEKIENSYRVHCTVPESEVFSMSKTVDFVTRYMRIGMVSDHVSRSTFPQIFEKIENSDTYLKCDDIISEIFSGVSK